MSSPTQNSFPPQNEWISKILAFASPPASAGLSIIPLDYFFKCKSALQTGSELPIWKLKTALIGGVNSAPVIALIIGTQMLAQQGIEKKVKEFALFKENKNAAMFTSTLLVGLVSAPPLFIFNGYSLNQTAFESLKSLYSPKQMGAMVTRETSFLLAIRISEPFSQAMKNLFGDNEGVAFASMFCGGAIGSLVGHPADTALTRWQKKLTVIPHQLMKGALTRAFGVGMLSIFYNYTNTFLTSQFNK